jgi:hypothetical protein
MSEYQYYEWQTVDRPLTEEEVAEVEKLSSHMDVVTSTQAVVTYSWGDFKHDPAKVLLRYFDAMLYMANWGSRRLAFRFPREAIDAEHIQVYCLEDWITLQDKGEFCILDISFDGEEGADWIEPEGSLGPLIPLRAQIMQEDYRGLYLAWLKAITLDDPEVAEVEPEPPVPAGLKELTAGLRRFAEVCQLDPHLIQAAAAASADLEPVPDQVLDTALAQLPRAECEAYLLRVLHNEPQVGNALRKRLAELVGIAKPIDSQPRRTAGELFRAAEHLEKEARRRQQAKAERKRMQELDELAKREESTWLWVDSLIEQKQAKPYDEAVALLIKLRDLAVYQNRLPDFERRIAAIKGHCERRPSLMERFRKARL